VLGITGSNVYCEMKKLGNHVKHSHETPEQCLYDSHLIILCTLFELVT
jgi:hypothetical protein